MRISMRGRISSAAADGQLIARHDSAMLSFKEPRMKKVVQILLILAIFAGVALSRGPKLEKEGKEWLAGYSEPAKVNVNGTWNAKEWGQIKLVQEQGSRDVTGKGDGWDITGVVSGDSAYLLSSGKGGGIVYSAKLTMEGDNKLNGSYSRFGASKGKPMLLSK